MGFLEDTILMSIELNLVWKGNCFVPASDQDMELCLKLKNGQVIYAKWTRKRNSLFHRKFFALLGVGFDSWEPEPLEGDDLKWGAPQKNFDRFRRDVTIAAGYYEAVYDLNGRLRLEAKSISFGKMEQDEFEKLYSNVINVFLGKILKNYNRDDLDKIVQDILNFD
jgi:hypothetical protein